MNLMTILIRWKFISAKLNIGNEDNFRKNSLAENVNCFRLKFCFHNNFNPSINSSEF